MTTTFKEARGILILIGILAAAFVWVRTATRAGADVAGPSTIERTILPSKPWSTPSATVVADRKTPPPSEAASARDADFKVTHNPLTATLCTSGGEIIEFVETQCPGSTPSSTNCPEGTYATWCANGTGTIVPTHCPLSIASTHCAGETAPTNCASTQAATSCPGFLVPTNCSNGVISPTNCPNGAVAATMCINTILVATHCPERIKSTLCADGIWPTLCPPGGILVPTVCPPAANPVICGPTQTLSVGHTPECPTPDSDHR